MEGDAIVILDSTDWIESSTVVIAVKWEFTVSSLLLMISLLIWT